MLNSVNVKKFKLTLSPFTFRFAPGLLDCNSGPGFLSAPDTVCFWKCIISHVKHKFRYSAKINFLPKKHNFKAFLTLWRQTMHMLHHRMLGLIPNKSGICINRLGLSLYMQISFYTRVTLLKNVVQIETPQI